MKTSNYKSILTIIFFLLGGLLQATNDSLFKLLPITKGAEKIKILNKLSRDYSPEQNEKAYLLAQEACKLSELAGDKQLMISSYISMVDIFFKRGDLNQSLIYCKKVFSLYNDSSDVAEIAKNYNFSGLIYLNTGNYNLAYEDFTEANKLYVKAGDKLGIVKSIHNLTLLEYIKGNFNKALEGYLYALELAEKENDSELMAHIQLNIGIVFSDLGNYKKALMYYERALKIREQAGNKRGIASVLTSIGSLCFNQGDYIKSLEYHQRAFELFKETLDSIGISQQYNNIGDVYAYTDKSTLALDYYQKAIDIRKKSSDNIGLLTSYQSLGNFYIRQKQYDKSIFYFNEANAIADKGNFVKFKKQILFDEIKAYLAKEDYKNAYSIQQQYDNLKDSLFTAEKIRIAEELQTRYETTKKEKELALKNNQILKFEKDRKINVLSITCLIVTLLLVLVIAGLGFKQQKQKISEERLEIKKDNELLETKQRLSEVELNNMRLKQEGAERQLKSKSNELTELAIHISHKNDFLKEVKEKLTLIKKEDEHTEDVLKKIRNIEKSVSQNLSLLKQKEEFQKSINSASKEFFDKLLKIHPDLSDSDKRLAAMLRINLSSKEIAAILNIEPKSVDMNRYRLRKKLNLDANEDLSAFLEKLS